MEILRQLRIYFMGYGLSWLRMNGKEVLQKNDVVTVEPGVLYSKFIWN
jgi:hypothetical protein